MTSTIPSPARPSRGLTAIASINLVFWSVVIGGYILIGEPFRPSPSREVTLTTEVLFGLLLGSAVAVGVVFLLLLNSTTSRERWQMLLSLAAGVVGAVGLILVANVVAAALVHDSMAVVGPTLTAVVPVGVALVAMLLAAMTQDRNRSSLALAFGLGAGLGLILFLLNLTSGYMNVIYE